MCLAVKSSTSTHPPLFRAQEPDLPLCSPALQTDKAGRSIHPTDGKQHEGLEVQPYGAVPTLQHGVVGGALAAVALRSGVGGRGGEAWGRKVGGEAWGESWGEAWGGKVGGEAWGERLGGKVGVGGVVPQHSRHRAAPFVFPLHETLKEPFAKMRSLSTEQIEGALAGVLPKTSPQKRQENQKSESLEV